MGTMSAMASGRRLLVGMLVLFVCDVIGGFLAVVSGVATWGEAWGFDTKFTVPLPVGAVQLVLAWLAARNVRPPVGLVAAVVLGVFCLISLLFGLFDGDLTNEVASAGYPGGGSPGGSSCWRSPPLSVCSPSPGRGGCTSFADGLRSQTRSGHVAASTARKYSSHPTDYRSPATPTEPLTCEATA